MLEENKSISRQYYEEIFAGEAINPATHDKYISPGYVFNDVGNSYDLSAMKEIYAAVRDAFPEFEVIVLDQVAEGEKVMTRWLGKGIHRGEYMGIPTTNRAVEVSWMQIDLIKDGKIAESWHNADDLGLMQQLGVVPPLGE